MMSEYNARLIINMVQRTQTEISSKKYLKITQAQEGLNKEQASCIEIRCSCRHINQFVSIKQRQQQVNDAIMLTTVSQTINFIQRLTLSQRCQLSTHIRCTNRTHRQQ